MSEHGKKEKTSSASQVLAGSEEEAKAKQMIRSFLNKHVQVKIEGFTVEGTLLHYQENSKEKPHRPSILILENQGIHVMRGNFVSISEGAVK